MRTRLLLHLVAALSMGALTVVAAAPADAIVGGTKTEYSNYPYFTGVSSIIDGEEKVCGGAWVAPNWVLTAAHCIGQNVMANVPSQGYKPAEQVEVYPEYDFPHHDLALVRTAQAGGAGHFIGVGSPWHPEYYAGNQPATILGDGRTSANDPYYHGFHVAQTVVRSDSYMNDIFDPWYWFDHWDDPHMIGAGSSTVATCLGDSGTPLIVGPSDAPVTVGVDSFGYTSPLDDGCDTAEGFTELSDAHLAWVAGVVPSIVGGWGPCTTSAGWPGHSVSNFLPNPYSGSHADGSHYWNIDCAANPVAVPSVAGATASVAGQVIASAGLVPVKGTVTDPTCQSIGMVADQDPAPGTMVDRGSSVLYVVWKKPTKCPINRP
ncbi:trypsin-like serine protease [Streptosporangiaceae bacterium NEAU-GS5]|nr:trypsin-like serine protease [Streptosporangiaceae bacterium NEAU-GS5]